MSEKLLELTFTSKITVDMSMAKDFAMQMEASKLSGAETWSSIINNLKLTGMEIVNK